MVGWMPCFSQISLIGTCSKRCSRRIFAFSSGLYRLRCFLFILLFLGLGKVAYFKSLKRTFQVKQNSDSDHPLERSRARPKPDGYLVFILPVVFFTNADELPIL